MNDSAGLGFFLAKLIFTGYAFGFLATALIAYRVGRKAAAWTISAGLLLVAAFLAAIEAPFEYHYLVSWLETLAQNFLMVGLGWVLVAAPAAILGDCIRRARRSRAQNQPGS